MVTQRSASIASSRKVRNVFVASSENIPSCGTPYSYPFILSFHSQQLSPPWVLSSNTTFHHSAPVRTRRHRTQAGVHRAVAQTRCAVLTLYCLPQTVCCILLLSPEDPFLSQLISPLLGDFSQSGDLSLNSASCQGYHSLFLFLFYFFHPTWLQGAFFLLVLLVVQSFPLMSSRCSVRLVPFVDVFLMYL